MCRLRHTRLDAVQEVQDPCLATYLGPGLDSVDFDSSASESTYVHHTNHRLFPDELQRGFSRMAPLSKCKDSTFYARSEWSTIATATTPFYTVLDGFLEEHGLTVRADGKGAAADGGSPAAGDATELRKALRKRYDGVLLALLRHNETGRVLCVGNTHLFYHPRFPHLKSMQACLMARAARQFVHAHGFALPKEAPQQAGAPTGAEVAEVMLMGDLNCLPHRDEPGPFDLTQDVAEWRHQAAADAYGCTSGTITLWSTGTLSGTHHEHPNQRGCAGLPDLHSDVGPLTSVTLAARGAELPLTTRCFGMGGETFEGTLDYIFVSSGLRVEGVLPMPYEQAGQLLPPPLGLRAQKVHPQFSKLPNKVWPSDHLAVVADLSFV